MIHPEADNIGIVYGKCNPPPPELLRHPVQWYVGKFCKLAFPIEGGERTERMWVKVIGLAEQPEELRGELYNTPVFVALSHGDLFEFSRHEILDVCEESC